MKVISYIIKTISNEHIMIYNNSNFENKDVSISGIVFGGIIGYGILATSYIRVTPQLGIGSLSIKGGDMSSSAVYSTSGLKCEFAILPDFSVSLTPEVHFALSKNDVFKELEDISNKIKGWGTGYEIRLGLNYIF